MRRPRSSHGLTLIEVLATIALLGIATALLLNTWSAQSEPTAFRALLSDLRGLDGRARAAARTGTPVALSLDEAQHRLVLHVRDRGDVVGELTLPEGASVEILRDG